MSEALEPVQSRARLRKPERLQMAMVVQCGDDLVGRSHPVRMVMAVVEKLDLSGLQESIKAREGVAVREATDPRLLVALWLYWCIRGIGAARELARRCRDSDAFQWLCGGVSVNHHLLSDFRTGHGEALDELFTQVIASLVDKDVVQVSRVSQDGVRVRVSAGASSFRREERLQELLAAARQRMAGEEGKKIYRQRAATSETVNADLRSYRGLTQITVRGLSKAKCVALWCALAYNLMHFGHAMLA